MSGFARALRGELYLLTHRRSVRRAFLFIALVGLVYVLGSMAILKATAGSQDLAPEQLAAWNFWPQWAAASRAALYFVELLILAHVAGSLPREVAAGVTRDPVTRRISRRSFVLARSLGALLYATGLYLVAVAAAFVPSWLLFDAGPVVEDGDILLDEVEILEPVVLALLHGLPAVLALAAFAALLSVACTRGVVASGIGLGAVLATGIFHDALGSFAPFLFLDTLPGFGPDSFLEQAGGFAQGLLNYYPESFNTVVAAGWWAPIPALVVAVYATLLVFRRRAL